MPMPMMPMLMMVAHCEQGAARRRPSMCSSASSTIECESAACTSSSASPSSRRWPCCTRRCERCASRASAIRLSLSLSIDKSVGCCEGHATFPSGLASCEPADPRTPKSTRVCAASCVSNLAISFFAPPRRQGQRVARSCVCVARLPRSCRCCVLARSPLDLLPASPVYVPPLRFFSHLSSMSSSFPGPPRQPRDKAATRREG